MSHGPVVNRLNDVRLGSQAVTQTISPERLLSGVKRTLKTPSQIIPIRGFAIAAAFLLHPELCCLIWIVVL
jgi:hypothetical protein